MQIGCIRRRTEDPNLSRSCILYNNPNHKLFIDRDLLGLLSVREETISRKDNPPID